MVAQPKPEFAPSQPVEKTAPPLVEAGSETPLDGADSPARALQAELAQRIAKNDAPISRRDAIAGFVVFCFAAWWALYMVVAALV